MSSCNCSVRAGFTSTLFGGSRRLLITVHYDEHPGFHDSSTDGWCRGLGVSCYPDVLPTLASGTSFGPTPAVRVYPAVDCGEHFGKFIHDFLLRTKGVQS